MKRFLVFCCMVGTIGSLAAQVDSEEYPLGESCTSIMVGQQASTDGSVITSHTCDGRYRTWMTMEPSADYPKRAVHDVRKGTMHTISPTDTTGVTIVGQIPQAVHTFAYLNVGYPCLNERQLAIGETTVTGPDTLRNRKGMFTIEELQRVALMRCDNARDAIRLIGQLVKKYGYGDGGECLTIADKREVWHFEVMGEGKDVLGGIWVAQRIPDDEVGVSANIPRIGRINRKDTDHFMASDNIEKVALKYGLWDGKGEFSWYKAFHSSYGGGKNFSDREFFILNALAPSLHLTRDMDELPMSVKPDKKVDVRQVIALLRENYEGTDMDMCRNIVVPKRKKQADGTEKVDTVVSSVANPWLTTSMRNMLNTLKPGAVDFHRTVSVAWCSYSHVTQLRHWLPDAVGGVCWISVDNPAQSPRIPIFCGTTHLPDAFARCGQKSYDPESIVWKFRKANKLATVAWQDTKKKFMRNVAEMEDEAFAGLPQLEAYVQGKDAEYASAVLNAYTASVYDRCVVRWADMEADLWQRFSLGF